MTYEEIIEFHGHECPGLAMGFRMACAGLEALSSMHAEDEELVAIVENNACGVDALQCVTGCTFGKALCLRACRYIFIQLTFHLSQLRSLLGQITIAISPRRDHNCDLS